MKIKSAALAVAAWLMLGCAITAGACTIEKIAEPIPGNGVFWSMAEAGDYLYIGTGCGSACYSFRSDLEATLHTFRSQGFLDEEADPARIADHLAEMIFGAEALDQTNTADWDPVIMAVHKRTGEAEVIFCEREIRADNPDIFPAQPRNCLTGYRMAVEFAGKLYFAGMGDPVATLVEVDPATNEARIVYHQVNENRGVAGGVRCLAVCGDELLMCLTTDTDIPGSLILASSDPGADRWRVIADQGDFDDLPAVMQADGLDGGGIWDIIEYNGRLYVTVVTDKNLGGQIHKQGFALYRGDQCGGSFVWTQVVGDQGTSGYPFGMGVSHATACDLWVYDGFLYLGTCSDPMSDLATGNFELLYNDLDHSVYLYRMDETEQFQMVGGRNDNPSFPEGPIGNLGAGLGNPSNQYIQTMGTHNGALYLGVCDTGIQTYPFIRILDGQSSVDVDGLDKTLTEVLRIDDGYVDWFLDAVELSETVTGLFKAVAGLADAAEGKNPVPEYRTRLAEFEAFRAQVLAQLEEQLAQPDFAAVYREKTGAARDADPGDLKKAVREKVNRLFAMLDDILYDETLHNYIYYLGCNYYAGQGEQGFDLLVSRDGVHFDAITRDGFGNGSGAICATGSGVFLGGTQLWRMDVPRTGDDAHPLLWSLLLVLSAGMILTLQRRQIKNREWGFKL